jgi:HlyD family secretion protein
MKTHLLHPGLAALTAAALVACQGDAAQSRIAGTVEIRQIRLAPLTAGRLVRLLKDEGDSVRAGDTVALLEQPGLPSLIAERRARAAGAASRTGEVGAAVAESTRAANDLARAGPLRTQGIVSAQQYDGLAAVAAAAASHLQAVRAAPTDAAAARAALQGTVAISDELVLTAPVDGIILTRYAEPGEAVTAGMPVLSLGVVARPWVRAYVPERLLPRIRLGTRVLIHADGYPDSAFTGTVVEISPQAEFTPRAALTERERADLVFGIKVEVGTGGGRLKAGLPVTLDIPLQP